jgi:uncharacterized phage protein (TIGR01671 family)
MRELKFRYVKKYKDGSGFKIDYQTLDEIESEDSWQGPVNYVLVSRDQYICLRDANKREIYDGDIVKAWIYGDEKPQILEVHYEAGGFCINYVDADYDTVFVGCFAGTIEVIGNIHENPELLEHK